MNFINLRIKSYSNPNYSIITLSMKIDIIDKYFK